MWERELAEDEDKEFLLHGLRYGFSIIDYDKIDQINGSYTKNSVSVFRNRDQVDKRIKEEVAEGNYVLQDSKPTVVSALSSVPKPNGDIRLIHDLSRPKSMSVNDHASVDHFQYQTLSEAIDHLSPKCYMAKIDLLNAYRSVGIAESNYAYTGLQWQNNYFIDTRLPFGARKSPQIFHRLTQAVRRMMARRGFKAIIVYLDDFLVIGDSYLDCLIAYQTLMCLLRSLGFSINYKKLVDPCTKVVFLGIELNTIEGTASLDQSKAKGFFDYIDLVLSKRRISRKELERLTGKLAWASIVLPWGRLHVRPLYNKLTQMKSDTHKCLVRTIADDLHWWHSRIISANGTKRLWDFREEIYAYTDSSMHAGGAFCNGDWFYTAWLSDEPHIQSHHINTKELAIIVSAAKRWGPLWGNKRVHIVTDNVCAMWNINNGTSVNRACQSLLRELCDLSLKFNFTITASVIRSQDNFVADAISRLHENGQLQRFLNAISATNAVQCIVLNQHMSVTSMFFMSLQIRKPLSNWTLKLRNCAP